MEDATLFDRQQEDEAVDDTQELLEERVLGERAVAQCGAERVVLGVGEEALPEIDKCFLHTAA